jgi:hypothetical protein
MSKVDSHITMKELLADREALRSVLENARDSAIRLHRVYNVPMAISRNARVVEVSPFDLQTAEERAFQK